MTRDKRRNDVVDPGRLLTGHGHGQSRLQLAPGQLIYRQGDPPDAVFYVTDGFVKISVVVPSGKEAVIALRRAGEFFGTRCLIGRRAGAASALTACSLIRVTTAGLIRLLREQPNFAEMFATYLVRQSAEDQELLVDQLTNSAEKRLARALLRLAVSGSGGDAAPIPARINQTLLAEMVGTTRSRVNFFMNKFEREGLIEYNRVGDINVRNTLSRVLAER